MHGKMSEKDRAAAGANFIAFLKTACRADVTAAQPRLTYDYFQRRLADEQRDRAALTEIFENAIKELQKPGK
jgi:hypothetical protein